MLDGDLENEEALKLLSGDPTLVVTHHYVYHVILGNQKSKRSTEHKYDMYENVLFCCLWLYAELAIYDNYAFLHLTSM